MKVICKTTPEISDAEIEEIYHLFYEVFGKRRDCRTFREEYGNTPLGYSYHSLLLSDDGRIVGFHSCMPFYYLNGDKRFMAALGIDSMVKKEFRDFFNFHDLITECQNRLKNDGCVLRIGFPNDNSYPILKKGLKHRDIGRLSTYCLVRNIGSLNSRLRWANFFSRCFSYGQYVLSYFSRSRRSCEFRYRKERESFDACRYKWFGGDYRRVSVAQAQGIYKIEDHEGVRTAFVMDVFPLSRYTFDAVVRAVYKREHRRIDMILYVGKLPFSPLSLLRIPHRFEPKRFNFTCKPLVSGVFDDTLYHIENWEVNLSNYDLL